MGICKLDLDPFPNLVTETDKAGDDLQFSWYLPSRPQTPHISKFAEIA